MGAGLRRRLLGPQRILEHLRGHKKGRSNFPDLNSDCAELNALLPFICAIASLALIAVYFFRVTAILVLLNLLKITLETLVIFVKKVDPWRDAVGCHTSLVIPNKHILCVRVACFDVDLNPND